MSALSISAKRQILTGEAIDLLGVVCQFVDNIEISKVSRTFRRANLLAVSRIFREKRNDIQLSHKLPEEREHVFQLLQTKIDGLSPDNREIPGLRCILEKYRNTPDHFFAIHFAWQLAYKIEIRDIADRYLHLATPLVDPNSFVSPQQLGSATDQTLNHSDILLIKGISQAVSSDIAAESYDYNLQRLTGTPRPFLSFLNLQENEWVDRITRNIQSEFSLIHESPLNTNRALNALYSRYKQQAHLLETSRVAFSRVLHTNASGSIHYALLCLTKIAEIDAEVTEYSANLFSFIRRHRQTLMRLGVDHPPDLNHPALRELEAVPDVAPILNLQKGELDHVKLGLNPHAMQEPEHIPNIAPPFNVQGQPANLHRPNDESPQDIEEESFSEIFFQLPIWLRIPLFPVWLSWRYIIQPLISMVREEIEGFPEEARSSSETTS